MPEINSETKQVLHITRFSLMQRKILGHRDLWKVPLPILHATILSRLLDPKRIPIGRPPNMCTILEGNGSAYRPLR